MSLKVIISPAKKLNKISPSTFPYAQPGLWKKTEQLVNCLKKKSAKSIGELMNLSFDLSQINYQRYQDFQLQQEQASSAPAALLFNGEVYSGLAANSWEDNNQQYANEHLFILSGLYGLLSAMDYIQAYRLEMGTKLKTGKSNNLYDFWGDLITKELQSKMTEEDVLINLASNEYFKAVKKKNIKQRIITPVFKEEKNGAYKVVMVYAKKARGLMANYIIQNQTSNVDDLKQFDVEGYGYNAALSSEDEWVFTR